MKLFFLIVGIIFGLWLIGYVIYTLWYIQRIEGVDKSNQHASTLLKKLQMESAVKYLAVWNYTDYAVLGLFSIGTLVLAADVFAVIRDRDELPDYHLPYLVSGLVFTFTATIFWLLRLLLMMWMVKTGRATAKKN
jgi:hypothetical protein